jgi:hypothetical protein
MQFEKRAMKAGIGRELCNAMGKEQLLLDSKAMSQYKKKNTIGTEKNLWKYRTLANDILEIRFKGGHANWLRRGLFDGRLHSICIDTGR